MFEQKYQLKQITWLINSEPFTDSHSILTFTIAKNEFIPLKVEIIVNDAEVYDVTGDTLGKHDIADWGSPTDSWGAANTKQCNRYLPSDFLTYADFCDFSDYHKLPGYYSIYLGSIPTHGVYVSQVTFYYLTLKD